MGDMGSRITPWTAHSSMGNDLYSLHYLNSCTGFRQTHWKISSWGNWILLMWLQRDVLEFLQLSSPFSGPLSSLYCEPLSLFTQKMSLQSRRLSCGCTENVHFPELDQVTIFLISTLFGTRNFFRIQVHTKALTIIYTGLLSFLPNTSISQ